MLSNQPIHDLMPHYTNSHFKKARTVWLAKGYKTVRQDDVVKGVFYNYSDRIWQHDWNKARNLADTIDKSLDRRSPAYIQEFLRQFFDDPEIKLVHVMAGFNPSNGFPYQVYGYISEKK